MKPVEVFSAKDFELPVQYSSYEELANHCNKLLSEKLVKYYGAKNPGGKLCFFEGSSCSSDTHIIYGLEPQPIPKEPVKLEFEQTVIEMSRMSYGLTNFYLFHDSMKLLAGKRVKVTVEEL